MDRERAQKRKSAGNGWHRRFATTLRGARHRHGRAREFGTVPKQIRTTPFLDAMAKVEAGRRLA